MQRKGKKKTQAFSSFCIRKKIKQSNQQVTYYEKKFADMLQILQIEKPFNIKSSVKLHS